MNRDEAVKKIAKEGYISTEHAEDLYDSIIPKPVVPQYVADWYEEHNDVFEDFLFQCVYNGGSKYAEEIFDKFEKWLINNEQALKTLINMHQYGYEVEKEVRYTVRFKGLSNKNVYLKSNLFRNFWDIEEDDFGCDGISHTRKELEEAGFGWVFDCDGIEIEEVE